MAYSNVTPPALPVFESPYYVLVFNYTEGAEDWYQVHLFHSVEAFTYDGSIVTTATAKHMVSDGTAWTTAADEVEPSLSPGMHNDVYQRIYTNHSILDGNGDVWLAADTVTAVGVSENWLRSFWTGVSLGLTSKTLFSKKEPVAYLYNGVRLPKLPEWDREKYPYAVIVLTDSIAVGDSVVDGIRYWLYFTAEPCVHSLGNNIPVGSMRYVLYADENTADICGSSVWGEWLEAEMNTAMSTFLAEYVWANADVMTANGEVKLSASEPIPVYE